ncbi:type IV secretion system DNA-binding domain-containing protein [Pseudoalteromonas sp. RB2-MNA-CIBAN-0110]|uniref:type IV secretion system DNA-binding domain-containing protein n=1 Tax=Pseudoalteromonas sp. RB2-MNA-CIBAN-0110 TaxID=3140439 RepID=UPI0033198476
MSNLPASFKRQYWGLILTISVITWLLSFGLILYMTWGWLTPWGDFSNHVSYWFNILKEILFKSTFDLWKAYWAFIVSHNYKWSFITYTFLSATIALFPAYKLASLIYVSGGLDRYFHVSGPYLFHGRTALARAKRAAKREKGELGIKLHPNLQIKKKRESGNIFVVGSQGSGKTVFITPIIQQIIDRGERAFIYDEKREFTALFYNASSTILIAPWDERGTSWNIQADASSNTKAELIAERLINETEEPIWSTGARVIFVGMMVTLNKTEKYWGWGELAKILTEDRSNLKELLLKHYPQAAEFIAKDSKTTESYFAQLNTSINWVHTLAVAWPRAYANGFSINSWVNDTNSNKPVIIIQANKLYKDIAAPIANAFISLMTSNILAQTNSTTRELWLFLDEIGNLPKNPSLLEWMSLGRSKGCRIVAGTQSISQLEHIYGKPLANTLLSMFTLLVSMRVGAAGETASYVSKFFGEREVEKPTSSAGIKEGTTQNWHREVIPVVATSELSQLPQPSKKGVYGFILIPGYKAVYKLCWPYLKQKNVTNEQVPAEWLKGENNNSSEKLSIKSKFTNWEK